MSKGLVPFLGFSLAILVIFMPSATASQNAVLPSSNQPSDLQTKVLQDSEGNVHVLWLVPALNQSISGPGIWYSKYSPNGTDSISPTRLTNSTTVQSTDLAVDDEGNAIIIWADDISTSTPITSTLYLLHFNGTQPQTTTLLTRHDILVLWPSLALGTNNSVYVTWTEYNPTNFSASVDYGRTKAGGSIQIEQLASYPRTDAFPPETTLVYDNSTQHLQVAWGESGRDEGSASTVSYAKLGANGTILTQLEVAKFTATLRQVTMTGLSGQDGAFVLWQTIGSNYALYVSQISAGGELVYVKPLYYDAGQSRYVAVSTDRFDNLYVVWYEPSVPPAQETVTSNPNPASNMTYVRMSVTGVIDQTGTGVFRDPIIGVAVLSDGMVYGVSPDGLVTVVMPTPNQTSNFALAAVALVGCVSVAGVASSVIVEEGRYRWSALYSRIGASRRNTSGPPDPEVLKLLARKPGLRIRELKHINGQGPVGIMSLVAMERDGLVASFREGLSRRFYVKANDASSSDALRTRILLRILNHPGIWEAQLAKDLALSQQIVHYHLKKLRETGLIMSRVDANGTRKLYRFADSKPEAGDEFPEK